MANKKFFIFSDESGTWHDKNDIYVRSWVVVPEESYDFLINKIKEISGFIGCRELKWKTIAGNKQYFEEFDNIIFKVFVTVSSPNDINWDKKYKITKNFKENIEKFDFGDLEKKLIFILKKKIYDDIKNVLFLNFYEKFHIKNATERIESIIKPKDYELVYRIDPPQMSIDKWSDILFGISGKRPEFPKSDKDGGIQFADLIAGCFKSLFVKDEHYSIAKEFFLKIKNKMIINDFKDNCKEIFNPNIIFYQEVNERLRKNIKNIWNL
jgi:hypothetical protein